MLKYIYSSSESSKPQPEWKTEILEGEKENKRKANAILFLIVQRIYIILHFVLYLFMYKNYICTQKRIEKAQLSILFLFFLIYCLVLI